jgi:GMP synthase-like glutamine amidotransferase
MNAQSTANAGSVLLTPPNDAPPRVAVHPPLTATPTAAATAPAVRRSALVVQPHSEHPTAPLIDALLHQGLDPIAVSVDERDPLPDPGLAPLVILVGKDRLTDARARGRLDRDIDWVRHADEAGTAVLGIGHGARVLTLALGGAVEPAAHPLRGWAMVDTAVPHLIAGGPWLTWQHDVITLPPGAESLAHNRLGPQAFRLGRHLGVQFHPEATPEVLAGWAAAFDPSADVHPLPSVFTRDRAAAAACTRRLLSSFIGGI